ncbi:MAG: AraC family transcriptional regulator [Phycisphaeraceae bacterium]
MGLFHPEDEPIRPLAPWVLSDAAFWEAFQSLLACDAALLALGDPSEPADATVLSTLNLSPETVQQWRADLGRDAETADAGAALAEHGHVLALSLSASPNSVQHWHLAVARAEQPYEPLDQQLGLIALRQLNAAFDHLDEPDLRRLLITPEHALLHADPLTEASLLRQPTLFTRLTEAFEKLVSQRWPDLADDASHNLPLLVDEQPTWARFRRLRPIDTPDRGPWYLELRPLAEQDAPPVGPVEDDRVARALAYLSDNYASSPTLNDVAEAVQVSPYHFHRLFVRNAGISPKHYLLRTQLMIARWLLRSTRRPIGEIATATGFASHGHFTATFHRHIGASPTAYREQA